MPRIGANGGSILGDGILKVFIQIVNFLLILNPQMVELMLNTTLFTVLTIMTAVT